MTAALLPCDHPSTIEGEGLPDTVLRVRRTFIDIGNSSTPSPCCNTTPAWFAPGLPEWNGPYTPASSRCADARTCLTKAVSAPYAATNDPFLQQKPQESADPFLQQKPTAPRRDPNKYVSNASMMSIPETEECFDFDDEAEAQLDRPHKLRIPALRDGHGAIWSTGTPRKEKMATPISTPLFGETSKVTAKLPLGALIGATTPGTGRQSPLAYQALSDDQALEALRSMILQRKQNEDLQSAPATPPQPVRLDLASCVAPPVAPPPMMRCDSSFASTASTSDGPHTPPPPAPEWHALPPLCLDAGTDAYGAMPSYSAAASYVAELRSNNINYAQRQLSSCPIRANEIAEQTMREELVRGYRAALAAGDPEKANRFLDAALKLGVANSID